MQRNRLLHPDDPRLAQAFSLLREVLEGGAANGRAEPQSGSGWEGPATDPLSPISPISPLGPDFLDSDFRALWQPLAWGDEPWSAAWQRQADGAAPDLAAVLPASSYRHWQPPSDFHASEGLAAFQQPFWIPSGWPEGQLRAADALAVADCLYDFIHALERFDVEAAMASVADDFHQLQAHRELDRQGFRHWIEELLDGLRGREIDVSLTEAPRPVTYGRLVLCETTLQVDLAATSPTSLLSPASRAVPSSLVLRLLLAFERDARGSWRILACGRLDEPRNRE
jgi:ketosteroid isomerase-like protein